MIKNSDYLLLWRLVNQIRTESGLPELLLGDFHAFLEIEFRAAVLKAGK